MSRFGVILSSVIFLLSCSKTEPPPQRSEAAPVKPVVAVVVNVLAIAGQAPEVVSREIGPATTCENVRQGKLCTYDKGQTEVVYIDGLADWITVGAMEHVPYDDSAIEHLGFSPERSTFQNEHHIRWSGTHGMQLIQMAAGGHGQVFFAYVKARTP